jgi:M6 family metalloprotease-like protein
MSALKRVPWSSIERSLMKRRGRRVPTLLASFVLIGCIVQIAGADDGAEDFKTVATAKTTRISSLQLADAPQRGVLGASVEMAEGKLTVTLVAAKSPAQEAGLRVGDVMESIGNDDVKSAAAFSKMLAAHAVGDRIRIAVMRGKDRVQLYATLGPASQPMPAAQTRAGLGLRASDPLDEDGARVVEVDSDSPAAHAGIVPGDVVLRFDDVLLSPPLRLADLLAYHQPGDSVHLTVLRDGKMLNLESRLTSDTSNRTFGRGRGVFGGAGADGSAFFLRSGNLFRRDVLRLMVLGIEFPDLKHNQKIAGKDWEDQFFSRKTFARNVTGQTAYGSLNDYFQEQSRGTLRVEGKMAGWVQVGKERREYDRPMTEDGRGSMRNNPLLGDALAKLIERDGDGALNHYDAVIFLYAGTRGAATRGSIFWPHKASVFFRGQRISYLMCEEGGARMTNLSLFGHEAGHILGLPDLYAAPENPGSVGLGVWCAMSDQIGSGRPQHYGAWCKEQLGWIKPAIIDPAVRQKLILSSIEESGDCFKVLVRSDGSEYFLLENRQRKGFDMSLPADGLLIWRVIRNRPAIEPSHGISGTMSPSVYFQAVPFPSQANNSFTPYTTPSSRSKLGGGSPVYITNIHRLADGRITFYIGYEFE